MKSFLIKQIKEAGVLARENFRKPHSIQTKKHRNDLLTDTDLAVNDFLVARIRESYPDHGIISEEMPPEGEDKEYIWTIDPIDGTKNFATGIPVYCIIVGLLKDKEPIMGAIYLPETDELFFAEKGKGATLNEDPIHCSPHPTIEDSYGVSGAGHKPERSGVRKAFAKLSETTQFGVNAFSCTGAALAYAACGRRDWAVRVSAHLWDCAAAVVLLREAGCNVTTRSGEEWTWQDREVIAGNPSVHAELLELLAQ